jgi:hypothetical protein
VGWYDPRRERAQCVAAAMGGGATRCVHAASGAGVGGAVGTYSRLQPIAGSLPARTMPRRLPPPPRRAVLSVCRVLAAQQAHTASQPMIWATARPHLRIDARLSQDGGLPIIQPQ